jgi:hypothetical protein
VTNARGADNHEAADEVEELVSRTYRLEEINEGFAAMRGGQVARASSSSAEPPAPRARSQQTTGRWERADAGSRIAVQARGRVHEAPSRPRATAGVARV